jgi:hypothetical protein
MLKQTVESSDRRRVFHLGDDSTPVDLGSFQSMVFRHDVEEPVRFSFRWRDAMDVRDPKSEESFEGTHVGFRGEVRDRGGNLEVADMRYFLWDDGEKSMSIGMEPDAKRPRRYRLTAEKYRLVRNMGRKWELPSPQKFYGFPDEAVLYYQNTAFTADLTLSLEQELRGLSYLGPLRDSPRRIYTWPGDTPEHVGWRGERTVDAILAARDRRISPGYRRRSQSFQAVVARWLRTLGLIDSFQIRPISGHTQLNEVVIRTGGQREPVMLPDVGFGVSQVLPVIVQCFYATPGTAIVIEQPELHLHPAVQAGLADLFIEAVQAREGGKDRNVQLLIESHSEHFLRRLMRRVAEGVIDPELVALYACESRPHGSIIRELDLDLFGNVRNWPRDFFGDPMEDIAAQAEVALERRLKEST